MTEFERGMVMSSMSDESVARTLGRSLAWVTRARAAAGVAPARAPETVQARAGRRALPVARPVPPVHETVQTPPADATAVVAPPAARGALVRVVPGGRMVAAGDGAPVRPVGARPGRRAERTGGAAMTVPIDEEARLMAQGLGCPASPARVLQLLMAASPGVVSLRTIRFALSRPGAEPPSGAAVATHVSRLRRALEDFGRPGMVATWGQGWALRADAGSLKRDILRRVELRERRAAPPAETRPEPHPADVSAEAALKKAIREGRGRGVSWANLSKMTGKSEADLRRRARTMGLPA